MTSRTQFRRRADKEQRRLHSSYVCHVVRQADIPALPDAVVKQPECCRGGEGRHGFIFGWGGGCGEEREEDKDEEQDQAALEVAEFRHFAADVNVTVNSFAHLFILFSFLFMCRSDSVIHS